MFTTNLLDRSDPKRVDLDRIIDLGRWEQWLISHYELRLMPGCILGSGSFGKVRAGQFYSTPVAVMLPKSNTLNRQHGLVASMYINSCPEALAPPQYRVALRGVP